MPFEVFRRHQRKLLAIFAIMAMFGFVVSDSLPKLLSPSYGGRDQAVATIDGKTVYRTALQRMLQERTYANLFVSELSPYMPRNFFGGVKDRDLVDALVLEREANRLSMPATPDMGREWLKRITSDRMNRETFEFLLARLNTQVSGEQLLADIANQVRLLYARQLLGAPFLPDHRVGCLPLVTPYDIFKAYREQNERVSAKLVEIPVEKFLAKVREPSEQEIQEEYDKYKNVLPDPARETPGFKIPRQIQVELLSIDGNALARSVKDKLTESELRTAYENRKSEFREQSELPDDLFAGQPELTPPTQKPFSSVRATLASSLAEEKAQAEIVDRFTKIKEDVLFPAANEYAAAYDDIEEAKKQGTKPKVVLPTLANLQDVARREGLTHEVTPLLSREQADGYGLIGSAEVGMARLSGGHKFAEEFFDPKVRLYEPAELTDALGTRFLARKIKDAPPRVPSLDEIRSEVGLAWKMAQARTLAKTAAEALAADLTKRGGAIKGQTTDGYRMVSIPPIARRQTSFLPGQFGAETSEESSIPEVTYAGDDFRKAYFDLHPGSMAVAPNEPKTVYYVMALESREPATFAKLYAPNGDEFRYKRMALDQAARRADEQWMGWLRQQAGITPDWVPPDEAKGKANSEGM
jgi:peptidyl-prolyl cis-trans isomerase D